MCWSEAARPAASQARRRHSYAAKLVKSPLIRRPRLERPVIQRPTDARIHNKCTNVRTHEHRRGWASVLIAAGR